MNLSCFFPVSFPPFVNSATEAILNVGGSLRDVQLLAGHSALSTTQRYIEADGNAQRRVVELA